MFNRAKTEWCRLIWCQISLQLNPAILIPIIYLLKIWNNILTLYDKIVTLSSSITQTWFSPGWGLHVSSAFCASPHQKHSLTLTLWCSLRVIYYVWEWLFEFLWSNIFMSLLFWCRLNNFQVYINNATRKGSNVSNQKISIIDN